MRYFIGQRCQEIGKVRGTDRKKVMSDITNEAKVPHVTLLIYLLEVKSSLFGCENSMNIIIINEFFNQIRRNIWRNTIVLYQTSTLKCPKEISSLAFEYAIQIISNFHIDGK